MKKYALFVSLALVLAAWPSTARAEWFYIGLHAGGQYLDLDALSGGEVFDQAVSNAWEGEPTEQPQPTTYSSEGAFVYGGYLGVSLGRMFRIGARLTHSWMDVHAENGLGSAEQVNFELSLLTTLIEAQFRLPLWIFNPFVGIGLGYAFLKSDTQIVSGSGNERYEGLGTNCFDAMAALGLDINLGRWFSLGAAVHFSFIGFFYEDQENPENTEAAWGFATDYVLRATFRI
jgi:opacity protein-like surface antigen